jgi:hypothetical protein
MLQRQAVPFFFSQGVDTKTNPHVQVVGKLLALENGVFTKLGQVSKRHGYTALSTQVTNATDIDDCDALATFGNGSELICFANARFYTMSEALDQWLDRGALVSLALEERPVVRNTYAQSAPCVARLAGMSCIAWEDTRGGVRCTVLDDGSGTPLMADVDVNANGERPRVVAHDSSFFIFYSYGGNIFYKRILTAAPTELGPERNPISTLHTGTNAWDVVSDGTQIAVAWDDMADSTGYLAILASPYTATSSAEPYDPFSVVTLWADDAHRVWLAYDTGGIQAVAFSTLGVTMGSTVTVGSESSVVRMAGVTYTGETRARLYMEISHASSWRHRILTCTVSNSPGATYSDAATTFTAATALVRAVGIAAKPLVYGTTAYLPVVHESTLQSTTFVVNEAGAVVSKASPGLAGGLRSRNTLSATPSVDGVFTFAATVKSAVDTANSVAFTRNGIELVDLDFSGVTYQTAELSGALHIAGGVLQMYDGKSLVEHGFHLFPENVTGTVNAGAGGLTASEVYAWAFVYEWTDAHGQIHRSAPGLGTISGATSYTAAASDAVTFTIPTLRLTAKTQVRVVVYRTEGNGSIFYRLTSFAAPTLNDTTTDTVSYQDTAADTAITGNELLYTTGDVLENIAPGASSLVTSHRQRLFLSGGPNPNAVYYSKTSSAGAPMEFTDAFAFIVEQRGESITALASLDDKLVIFKRNAVFAVYGDGPNATGTLGEFADPQLITGDAGCIDARTVVSTSGGIMFKSTKGIYLLDRGLNVAYIGAPVEDWNDETVTSATLIDDVNQVRFTTSAGPTLVFDYAIGQWSTFTGLEAVDAVMWDGAFTLARSNGVVWTESDGYADPIATVTMSLTTGWLSPAGLQGFLRLYEFQILGHYRSEHRLQVEIGYDFHDEFLFNETVRPNDLITGTWGSGATWGVAGSVWGGEFPRYKWEIHPTRQKCESFRVRLTEIQDYGIGATDPSPGEGLSFSALNFIVGMKGPSVKVQQSRYKA